MSAETAQFPSVIAPARRPSAAHPSRVWGSARSPAKSAGASFAETLRLAKQGDGRAFGALYSSHAERVLSFARARNADDPEGVTNEVFLAAFKALHSFTGNESAFTGWVFQIARRKVIDAHRGAAVRPTAAVETNALDRHSSASAEDRYLSRFLSASVTRVLEGIEDAQREVIMLRVVSGLSFQEIGTTLGKRPAAAKEQYRRGIAAMEAALRSG